MANSLSRFSFQAKLVKLGIQSLRVPDLLIKKKNKVQSDYIATRICHDFGFEIGSVVEVEIGGFRLSFTSKQLLHNY